MAINLNIQDQKIELIQWLSTIEDVSVIEKILALKKEEDKDWYSDISEIEKKSIEIGLQDADEGRLTPHSKARSLYEKWL